MAVITWEDELHSFLRAGWLQASPLWAPIITYSTLLSLSGATSDFTPTPTSLLYPHPPFTQTCLVHLHHLSQTLGSRSPFWPLFELLKIITNHTDKHTHAPTVHKAWVGLCVCESEISQQIRTKPVSPSLWGIPVKLEAQRQSNYMSFSATTSIVAQRVCVSAVAFDLHLNTYLESSLF